MDIIGFDLEGAGSKSLAAGLYVTGSYSSAQYNHVHHIAQNLTCSNHGGSAINTDHYITGNTMMSLAT